MYCFISNSKRKNANTPRSYPVISGRTFSKATAPGSYPKVLIFPSHALEGPHIRHTVIHSYFDLSSLTQPESFYSPLAQEFQEHVQRVPGKLVLFLPAHPLLNTLDTTPRAVYASYVVPETLKSRPPAWYWVGATTGIVRFMDIFGFRTVWVGLPRDRCVHRFRNADYISRRITYSGPFSNWASCRKRRSFGDRINR